MMLHGLDLFSGIGGLGLALDEWVRPVAFCESDRFAQSVLLSRMAEGKLPSAPIWDDVKTLRGDMLPPIDIITGGFPCQDLSVAGNGAGLEGKRSGLFFEIIRLASEIRPGFIFLENVPAITIRRLDRVLLELTALGYDSRWTIVSASEIGAPHRRERWFLLAHANSSNLRNQPGRRRRSDRESKTQLGNNGPKEPLANANGLRELPKQETGKLSFDWLGNGGWWASEPNVGRVANGVPNRVDRIRCLGNAVVPLQAKTAFEKLIGIKGGVSAKTSFEMAWGKIHLG